MRFPFPMLHPWGEVPKLAVITIVGHPHLGSNKKDLSIVDDHAAVVNDSLVVDRPTDRQV